MTDIDQWLTANNQYLATAVTWLRERLERLAEAEASPDAGRRETLQSAPCLPRQQRSLFERFLKSDAKSGGTAPVSPFGGDVAEEAPRPADGPVPRPARMVEAEEAEQPPALVLLSRRLGLGEFERDTLLLCAASELDTRIASLCARAQDNPNRSYPTFALALALLDKPAWEALSPERPLRHWRLIEINQPGAQALTTSPLRADERIVNYIKGLNYLDDRLTPLLAPLDAVDDAVDLPPSQQAAVDTIVSRLRHALAVRPLVQLLGTDASSKQLVAQRTAAEFGLTLYRLSASALPAQAPELETLARLWQRESLLLPIALYVDAFEGEGPAPSEGHAVPPLHRFLTRCGGLIFLDTREVQTGPGWDRLREASLLVDIVKPTPAEQRAAWSAALGPRAGDSPGRLAGQFNLGIQAIRQISRTVPAETEPAATSEAHSEPRSVHARLWGACLMNTRPRLDMLAQRVESKATWDDIVLPDELMASLRQMAAQVGQRSKVYEDWGFHAKMNRGLGISALFTGESGTGKTMAAEVIANDLRLDLYRIDLSAVVNKYIGETEKNLRRLFDAAEDGGAILFFDECDAMFGKRSEVKDSHDRYANIEINYLLQRMEAYQGLAILATNMKNLLDPAFMRRLRFTCVFPFPGEKERAAIWRKVLPPAVPTEGLDFEKLARLIPLAGGSILNIALNAAFLAADAGTPVTMALIREAARSEFRKLERPFKEAEFRMVEAVGPKR